jgi:hypothetical protein
VAVKPIQRPRDKWYVENFDEMCKYFIKSVNKCKLENVTILDALFVMSQKFETDMVHQTMETGSIFVDGLLRAAEDFFNAELINLEGEQEKAPDAEAEGSSGTIQEMVKKDKKILGETDQRKMVKNLQQMADRFNQRKENDNLIFARIREELDFISNAKKEDRVIITGLTSRDPCPVMFEEKKKDG